ncbi:hypothetical protein DH2020_037711 [Rehmannia glutinosa]|uniref:Uncharacterized protein n=1 Tax=Rehmannia glutinosa TaxID=99300 RepID=A0ABR0V0V9_REHGL
MATTMMESLRNHLPVTAMVISNPKPLRVCFSYAAYAKNLIRHLYSTNIPVEAGLSDAEFSAVEPPRRAGLPQLALFLFTTARNSHESPDFGNLQGVSKNEFWIESLGDRPDDNDRAVKLAKRFLKKAPILVPIYRNFYIPSTPCMAGNPVFYVHGGDVRLWSFDIAGFFQRFEFGTSGGGGEEVSRRPSLSGFLAAPAWAATEARRIEFWSEMAEARTDTRGWWSGDLGLCLEEVCWRLRDGGWREEDVREMMMMDGCDEVSSSDQEPLDRECVEWRVRVMSARLLRAGWSTEDVVESLGCPDDCQHQNEVFDGDSQWGGSKPDSTLNPVKWVPRQVVGPIKETRRVRGG